MVTTDPHAQPLPWISVAERLPRVQRTVSILIADEDSGIDAFPTTARFEIENRGTEWEEHVWWAGVPGKWMRLPADGWIVTHWTELPAFERNLKP